MCWNEIPPTCHYLAHFLILAPTPKDRILDMGFRDQMVKILDYLPKGAKEGGPRQTLLFSATQTKRVADLATLSLYKPEYIGVHDKLTTGPTPELLQQSYVVTARSSIVGSSW